MTDAKKFFKIQDTPSKELPVFQAQDYDDEAIATENYYGFDEQSVGGVGVDKGKIYGNDCDFGERPCGDKAEEEGARANPWQDENAQGNECKRGDCGEYYFKIKSRLNDLFRDFPPQKQLAAMVKESRWAKVESGGKHYVVGVIFSRCEPKYICYGLPGNYGQEPQALCGYSSFIPLSPFDQKGNGYWVMFQYADSGKRVEKG